MEYSIPRTLLLPMLLLRMQNTRFHRHSALPACQSAMLHRPRPLHTATKRHFRRKKMAPGSGIFEHGIRVRTSSGVRYRNFVRFGRCFPIDTGHQRQEFRASKLSTFSWHAHYVDQSAGRNHRSSKSDRELQGGLGTLNKTQFPKEFEIPTFAKWRAFRSRKFSNFRNLHLVANYRRTPKDGDFFARGYSLNFLLLDPINKGCAKVPRCEFSAVF